MRCFVTGASGLLGGSLIEGLRADGHEVLALSRRPQSGGQDGVEWVTGDPAVAGPWQEALSGCDAVVHLAGEPIAARRWTAAQKQRLIDSRVDSTRLIAQTIREASTPPSVLVNASAVGIYGSRGEEVLDEDSTPGDDFLARLSLAWEEATAGAAPAGGATRVVLMRIGIVLDPEGGALQKLLPPFRLGLGGPLGPSDRWFPWVHLEDAVGLIRFALEAPLQGPVNVVAPGAIRMGDFARTLGRVLHRPALLPVPLAPLRIVLGEFAGYLSPGQHIRPSRALEAGYEFVHPELEGALRRCLDPGGSSAPARG